MRIARVKNESGTWLARVDGATATPIAEEVAGPGRDALREALAAGVDIATAEPVGPEVGLASCTRRGPVKAAQKVMAIGLNYADHAKETGKQPPAAPILFIKTANSIVGPDDPIEWSLATSGQVDYEAELAAVIGRRARDVTPESALDHVLGYTVCNDVSARDA